MMIPLPERAQEVLDAYFHLLDSKLLNFLEAYYIYGSISMGAFTKDWSDLDFIYTSFFKRKNDALDYIKYIIRECNSL